MKKSQNPVQEGHWASSYSSAFSAGVLPAVYSTTTTFPELPVIPSWADLGNILGPIEWAWEGWLPKGMLTILASESGIGKSALGLRVCASFLSGVDWQHNDYAGTSKSTSSE